jgi:hypothetical protein
MSKVSTRRLRALAGTTALTMLSLSLALPAQAQRKGPNTSVANSVTLPTFTQVNTDTPNKTAVGQGGCVAQYDNAMNEAYQSNITALDVGLGFNATGAAAAVVLAGA